MARRSRRHKRIGQGSDEAADIDVSSSALDMSIAALETAIAVRVPSLLWGPPGIGKTAICEQIARRLDMGFVPVSVSTRAPEDFSGLPIPRPDGVRQEPLSWLTRSFALASKHRGGCLVLLDEFSTTPPAVQAAMLGLVQSRYCGDTEIPRTIAFVAAANPTSIAADGWELPPPTVSRWLHLDWPCPTVEAWGAWLMKQPGTPRWEGSAGAQARGQAIGYLTARQTALLQEPVAATADGRAVPYACPRSWEAAVRLRAETDDAVIADVLTEGALGPGVTTEFVTWLQEADLPDPESVLREPSKWQPYSGRADRTLAVLLSVVGSTTASITQDRYAGAVTCLVSAARAGQAGVALVAGRSLMQDKRIGLMQEPEELRELQRLVDADLS